MCASEDWFLADKFWCEPNGHIWRKSSTNVEFSFKCVTYEHNLRMFCIQSMIYGRGEGFILDTRPINTFLINFGIKVLFLAEELSFRSVRYEHSLRMVCIQSRI